jgi:hypothetical protein
MPPELALIYDAHIHPIAAKCTACNEEMPAPSPELYDAVEAITWLSMRFVQHTRLKHSAVARSDEVLS